MKIVHVDTGKEWRGGQRQCFLLHQGLMRRGYHSFLICNEEGEFAKKNIDNMHTFVFKGEVNPLGMVRLNKLIKQVGGDIVHSHDAHSLTPLLMLKMMGARFHLVHTRRVDFSVNKNRLSLYKYNNPYVHLVAISQGVKRVLTADGIAAEKIEVIYSGVPQPAMPDAEAVGKMKLALGLTGVGTVFGTVANFSPHKDLLTMLRGYAAYLPQEPESRLLMVGGGPLYDQTVQYAAELGLADNIVFTGFRSEILVFMKCMDIFLVSSEQEGLNTSIIDAMHMGLPVVATNAGGIGELVEDGVNGFLVSVKDPAAFAQRMALLAGDKGAQHMYSAASREKAKLFTDAVMIEKYISLYSRLSG